MARKSGAPEIEITEDMIEAGLNKLYENWLGHEDEQLLRRTVRAIFIAMMERSPTFRR